MRRLLPLSACLLVVAMAAPALGSERPVAAYRAKLAAQCKSEAGKLTILPGFETRADFNGDGRTDLLLDTRQLSCSSPTTASVFCGTGGCDFAVFISGRKGLSKAYEGSAIAATILHRQGGDHLSLSLHGTACGLSGSEPCIRRLGWNGQTLAPLP